MTPGNAATPASSSFIAPPLLTEIKNWEKYSKLVVQKYFSKKGAGGKKPLRDESRHR